MSKKRVSTSQSRPRTSSERLNQSIHVPVGFAGISLAGGKSDKTCLSFIEYYSGQNKIFLAQLLPNIKSEGDISSDLILYEEIKNRKVKTELVAYNVPLSMPKCMRCRLRCPGYESCSEPEILWMWNHYRRQESLRNNKKLFTPYTERCVEQYFATELEEPFQVQHALGANLAPLTARAHFLNRRLRLNAIEVFPKLTLWRVGMSLNLQKMHLRKHKLQFGGFEAREAILKDLQKKNIAFIYEQDVRQMIENSQAFDSFLCALTAVLKFKGQCDKRPSDFPKQEGWIEVPNKKIVW